MTPSERVKAAGEEVKDVLAKYEVTLETKAIEVDEGRFIACYVLIPIEQCEERIRIH